MCFLVCSWTHMDSIIDIKNLKDSLEKYRKLAIKELERFNQINAV